MNESELGTEALKAKTIQTKCRKVAGRLVRQLVKEKIDFISLQQAKKLANTTNCPMFLGIIRGTED